MIYNSTENLALLYKPLSSNSKQSSKDGYCDKPWGIELFVNNCCLQKCRKCNCKISLLSFDIHPRRKFLESVVKYLLELWAVENSSKT